VRGAWMRRFSGMIPLSQAVANLTQSPVRALARRPTAAPACPLARATARRRDLALVDRKLVYLKGRSGVEPCDPLSDRGHLVHRQARGRGGSASLSHLFAKRSSRRVPRRRADVPRRVSQAPREAQPGIRGAPRRPAQRSQLPDRARAHHGRGGRWLSRLAPPVLLEALAAPCRSTASEHGLRRARRRDLALPGAADVRAFGGSQAAHTATGAAARTKSRLAGGRGAGRRAIDGARRRRTRRTRS
jgi:hypothetical protein